MCKTMKNAAWLCLAVLTCFLLFGAVRADADDQIISQVDLTVTVPEAGKTPVYQIGCTGQHVHVRQTAGTAAVSGVTWSVFNEEDQERQVIAPEEPVIAGARYWVGFALEPDPGWAFQVSAMVSVTVNGDPAANVTVSEGSLYVEHSFPVAPIILSSPEDQYAVAPWYMNPDPDPAVFKATVASRYEPYDIWYYSDDNGETWLWLGESTGLVKKGPGVFEASLSVNGEEDLDGRLYKCRIMFGANELFTEPAKLTVSYEPLITEGPEDRTVTAGETVSFTVSVTGDDDFRYQWYFKAAGSSVWKPVQAASGKTWKYELTAETRHNGYQYRCEVCRGGIPLFTSVSDIATLTVKPSVFTKQPTDQFSVKTDSQHPDPIPAVFSVQVSASSGVTYRWQALPEGGSTWKNCVNGKGGVSGCTTKNLKVVGDDDNRGTRYRCGVTIDGVKHYSASALLTVYAYPWITTGPEPVTAAVGQTVSFTVVIAGSDEEEFLYQWYYNPPQPPSGSR